MKKKSKILNESSECGNVDISDGTANSISIHYESGKTCNGLVALEIMKEGDVQWDRAMSLFQEAEKNYLHGYEPRKQGHQTQAEKQLTKE